MSEHPANPIQRAAGPIYFLAFLYLFLSLVDYLAYIWPLTPGQVNWRYGAIGLVGGFLLTPLMGLVLLLLVAGYLEHRGVRVLTGVLSGTLAIILLLGTMLFLLDALQMRGTIAEAARPSFDGTTAKAVLKMVSGAICAAWIALVSVSKLPSRAGSRREARPLVVGASESGRQA